MSQTNDTPGSTRRRWLCVAFAFPPVNRSGTHRTVGFVRHLFARGFDATVLTAKPDGESMDARLVDRVPPTTRVVQTRCGDLVSLLKGFRFFKKRSAAKPMHEGGCADSFVAKASPGHGLREWVSRLLQMPDSKIGWIPSAVRAGLLEIRRDRHDVIFSTSPYVSAHLVAMILTWRTKLPWVADFRDPWGDNPFRDLGFASVRRLDAWLERLVLRSASHIVMNTPTAREALCRRIPKLAGKCSTITNGIDFDLIDGVAPERIVPTDCFALTHCGQFYGMRTPKPWFNALRKIRATDPVLANRIRFVLVGAQTYDGYTLSQLAEESGVGDLVEVIGSKSHAETLSIMAGSDALALATNVGVGSELQIPNKLFEYLGMRKPIVAAVDERNPAKRILEGAGLGVSICAPGDVSGLARAIKECIANASSGHAVRDSASIKKLGRGRQAAALAQLFEKLTARPLVESTSPTLESVEDKGVGRSLAINGGVRTMSAYDSGLSG